MSASFTADPNKYPQKAFKPKPCRRCRTEFEPLSPSHLYCGDDCKRDASDEAYLKRNYNITLTEWREMYEGQNGLCAICNEPGFKMKEHHKMLLMVDHCHKTGKVRGLLCHNCNRALGLLKDDVSRLTKAINYLNA